MYCKILTGRVLWGEGSFKGMLYDSEPESAVVVRAGGQAVGALGGHELEREPRLLASVARVRYSY